jgi:adenosylcobinamide-GDP ribazoletransferase
MTAPGRLDLDAANPEREKDRASWRAPSPLRGIRAAFVVLTRVPLGGFPYRREDWAWAAAHAPLVGLVVGALLAGLDNLLLSPLGPMAAAVLVVGASLLVTGAFHEDGLADTCDALGGGRDAPQVLAILKDSRIGSYGGAGLVVSIAGRAALLAHLGPAAVWALPIIGCGARVGPIWLMAALPYVTPPRDAKSRDVTRGGWPQSAVATAWFAGAIAAGLASGVISPLRACALAAALASVATLTGWRYRRRAGGITGDFLGATEQLGELAALVVLAWSR